MRAKIPDRRRLEFGLREEEAGSFKGTYHRESSTRSHEQVEVGEKEQREAVRITVGPAKSHAKVLGGVRNGIPTDASETRIHKTALPELIDCADKHKLEAPIKAAVPEIGEVKVFKPKARVEITNLDCLATVEKVENAIQGALKEGSSNDLKVSSQWLNHREL